MGWTRANQNCKYEFVLFVQRYNNNHRASEASKKKNSIRIQQKTLRLVLMILAVLLFADFPPVPVVSIDAAVAVYS